MSLRNYFQGIILILILVYIQEAVYFSFITVSNEWLEILRETIFIEIIPFTAIYFYGYKVINEIKRNQFFITVFIVMLIVDIIFLLNIIQGMFYDLSYKNNEYINFILVPFIEFFYFIKINMYMAKYVHIGIYAAIILIMIKNKKNKIQETNKLETNLEIMEIKKDTASKNKKKDKKSKIIFQGILFGLMPITLHIIMNLKY